MSDILEWGGVFEHIELCAPNQLVPLKPKDLDGVLAQCLGGGVSRRQLHPLVPINLCMAARSILLPWQRTTSD